MTMNIIEFQGLLLNFLTDEMTVELNMFSMIMVKWILSNNYCSLVVTLIPLSHDLLISIQPTISESKCLRKFRWPMIEILFLHCLLLQHVVSCYQGLILATLSYEVALKTSNTQQWIVCQYKTLPNLRHCMFLVVVLRKHSLFLSDPFRYFNTLRTASTCTSVRLFMN